MNDNTLVMGTFIVESPLKNKDVKDYSKEIFIKRCVLYCIHNKFSIKNIHEFVYTAHHHFSFLNNKVFISNCPYIYFICSFPKHNERTVVFENNSNVVTDEILFASTYTHDYFNSYKEMFLLFLRHNDCSVGSLKFSSGSSIDQELGTCWVAACLNLLLNIPEVKVIFWNKMGIKNPKYKDVVFDTFINSKFGNLILTRYTRRFLKIRRLPKLKIKKIKNEKDFEQVSEHVNSTDGGYPDLLVKCIKTELGLTTLTHTKRSYKAIRDQIRSISENLGSPFYTAMVLSVWRLMEKSSQNVENFKGFIITGTSTSVPGTSHAMSVVKLPNGELKAFNWGFAGGYEVLSNFFELFGKDVILTAYKFSSTRKKLNFDSPINLKLVNNSTKTHKQQKLECTPHQVYDRSTRMCRSPKIKKRPKCSPPMNVYDRSTRMCRSPKIKRS